MMIFVVVVLVVAALAAMALGFVFALRLAVRQVQHQSHAEREAVVKAALEQAAVFNRELVGAQARAGEADLDAKKDLIASGLAQVQADLKSEFGRVNELVGQLQRDSAASLGAVQAQLRAHSETTQALSATTQGLREALASTKARGQWGERMAEDVLRLAGFIEHVNYEKQVSVDDGTGIPDYTFLLPKGHVLYMDVKFPLAAYLRYLEASTDAERAAHCSAFLRDVKVRVKDLAARQYSGSGRRAFGEVLLFIPNETISGFIHEHEPSLIEDALGQGIVLCSPITLFALLAVIRQAYDSFMVEQTSDEILRLLGAFNTQYDKFATSIDVLGKRIESAQRAFDDMNGTRRRQLERPLIKIEELRRAKGLAVDPLLTAGADVLELDDRRAGDLGA